MKSLKKLDEAIEAVDENLDVSQQDLVLQYANAINEAVNSLVYLPADYTRVYEAVAASESIDRLIWSQATLAILDQSVSAVNYSLNVTQQSIVDGFADRINSAISSLEYADVVLSDEENDIIVSATAKEIYQDMDGEIDYFVAGIGTGGTISGVGKYLKERNPKIKIIGVEPSNSAVITTGVSGSHKIQGIGAGFIPKNLDLELIDDFYAIRNDEAYEGARILGKEYGILVGISSGAAYMAALKLLKECENKKIVVLFPDTGERYLSEDLYE